MTFTAGEPRASFETPSLDGHNLMAIRRLSLGTGQLFASGELFVWAIVCLLDHTRALQVWSTVEHHPHGRCPAWRLASLLACASTIVMAVLIHPASGYGHMARRSQRQQLLHCMLDACDLQPLEVTSRLMHQIAAAGHDIRVSLASSCFLLSSVCGSGSSLAGYQMSPELLGSSEQQQGFGDYTPAAAPASAQRLPASCLRTAPRSAFKSRLQYSDGDEVPASLLKAERVPQSSRCACQQPAGLADIHCDNTAMQLANDCLASLPGKMLSVLPGSMPCQAMLACATD